MLIVKGYLSYNELFIWLWQRPWRNSLWTIDFPRIRYCMLAIHTHAANGWSLWRLVSLLVSLVPYRKNSVSQILPATLTSPRRNVWYPEGKRASIAAIYHIYINSLFSSLRSNFSVAYADDVTPMSSGSTLEESSKRTEEAFIGKVPVMD